MSERGARGRLTIVAAVFVTLVAMTSLTVVLVPRPAAADQVATLKAQARSVSQRLVQDQLQVDAYHQQYSVESAKVAADTRAITQVGEQIAQDQQQVDADIRDVRQLAISSYMSGGPGLSRSDAVWFGGNAEAAQVIEEYATIATGNIETALDQLLAAQRALQVYEATLQQQELQDKSDQNRQAAALGQATSTEQQMASVRGEVTGQLAAAVAEQAASQAAAATAAVDNARKTGRKSAATGSASTDPALNAFLLCVVRAESGGNYGAVSPGGQYMGAFQFSQATWNTAARAAGRPDLVGIPPNRATRADQDTVAVALYALDGRQPWLGDRCSR